MATMRREIAETDPLLSGVNISTPEYPPRPPDINSFSSMYSTSSTNLSQEFDAVNSSKNISPASSSRLNPGDAFQNAVNEFVHKCR